jgi:hypothetical protein
MLAPNNIKEAAFQAAADLRPFTAERQARRTAEALARFSKDWKQASAKAFMKHIRNDNKAPLASFPDPDNIGNYTANTKRIDKLFCEAWEPVFQRPADQPPPDWSKFKERYGAYITPIGINVNGPPTAEELHAQAKRFWSGSATG